MPYDVRLCTVVKRNDFEGYGFNLHSEANKPGQFIGHVEANSPAFQAGLLKNDFLIEVNGFNVCDENHQQVVNRIKENPSSVTLLIIDAEGYNHCRANNIEIKKDMAKSAVKSAKILETPKETKTTEPLPVKVQTKIENPENPKPKPVSSTTEKSNLEHLSIEEIRAKVAESGAKKRRERAAPNSFKDRANLFEQL